MFFVSFWSIFQWYFRPFIKWFLRKTTKLCELQRICYGYKAGAPRCLEVEKSLVLSRTLEVKELILYLDNAVSEKRTISERKRLAAYAVSVVLEAKRIDALIHAQFVRSFGQCVQHIWGYKHLSDEVEELRRIQFDSYILDHEEKLIDLWNLLMPNEALEGRITKQWQDIGFQGDDPKTDFRGMGLLGLENLLYFAREYQGPSSHVLSHSHHPKYGYTFAVVGINITSMAYYLLKDGSAKTFMYNVMKPTFTLDLFHQFYCYLFYEFDKLWIESKPQNMMEFSIIYKRFEASVRSDLSEPMSQFRINFHVDNV